MNFLSILCVALIASLMCVSTADAAVSFPSDDKTSTVSMKKFTDVTTDTIDRNNSCGDVPQLMITVAPSSDKTYSVTMFPADYVEPFLVRSTLKFKLNKDFYDYKGEAGVIVYMPPETLEEVEINVSGMAVVHEEVVNPKKKFSIEGSTSAQIFVDSLTATDLDIDLDTSAMAVVIAAPGNDELEVEVDDIDTSAIAYIEGAYSVDVDDIDTSGYLQLTGDYLEKVEIDGMDTSAIVYAEYVGKKGLMDIDDIDTSAQVILQNCDRLKIDDASGGATVITDSQSNCDDISSVLRSRFSGVTCTVVDDIGSSPYAAEDIPATPKNVKMEVDLTTEYCLQ